MMMWILRIEEDARDPNKISSLRKSDFNRPPQSEASVLWVDRRNTSCKASSNKDGGFGPSWKTVTIAIHGHRVYTKTEGSGYARLIIDTASRSSPVAPRAPFGKCFERLAEVYTIRARLCWDTPVDTTSQLMEGLAQAYARWPDRKPLIATMSDGLTSSLPCFAFFLAYNKPA